MIALYQAGRQGEALRADQRARTTLAEELGIEPGTELRRLEGAMVAHDPSLDAVLPGRGSRAPVRAVTFLPSMQVPEVRFADSDGCAIAWSEWGSGPEVLVVPPLLSNVELHWEHEIYRRYLERMGRHIRVVAFDKRGIGLSDRFSEMPTLEQRTKDVLAVMNAAGFERPALFGLSEGGLMAQLFTVLHPERVERLALANSFAGASIFIAAHTAPDGSFGPLEAKMAGFGKLVETWGRDPQYFVDWFAPSQSGNESFVRWIGRFQRLSTTAADLERQILSLAALDGTERLGEITAPTLVGHGVRDAVCPASVGHAIVAAIPDARLVGLDTADHFLVSSEHWAREQDVFLEFLTGSRPQRRVERRFASVVFTDIIGSTAQGMSAGDEGWCDLLDSHDRIAWETADRHRGTIVKSTGDGLLARFDSPSQAVDFCAALRAALTGIGLRIRCGVHTGEIEMRESGDIAGTAVNLAARVEEAAGDGEVFVSSTVRDMLLGGDTRFEDRGEHALKRLPQLLAHVRARVMTRLSGPRPVIAQSAPGPSTARTARASSASPQWSQVGTAVVRWPHVLVLQQDRLVAFAEDPLVAPLPQRRHHRP